MQRHHRHHSSKNADQARIDQGVTSEQVKIAGILTIGPADVQQHRHDNGEGSELISVKRPGKIPNRGSLR